MALRIDEWRLKITENVNSVLGKLNASAQRTAGKFTAMQDRINRSSMRGVASLRDGFAGAANVANQGFSDFKQNMLGSLPLPGAMASGLAKLAGPLGIAIALTAALGLGLVKGVQAAEQFNVGFRELRNLNMDLDSGGIAALKNDLLDLSQAKGLDPQKVTQGYYDIQSATGQTGKAVLDLVGRVGEASRALNMDMATSINGVGKAMVAFGLGTEDLDTILASNAKTVQMGIVTFDQLAKSQTEYAGAAASANQSVDTANKLFAIFTQHTKSADIAATYTKSAFMDLAKESTVKGLKKIGVSVFDANKQMRSADAILRDLVPKFSDMSDQTFAKLKEEIGGSEGIKGLLDAAKASGADTLRVLEGFDSSRFDLNKAIGQANGDLDVMKDKLMNSIQVELIRVGEVAMPYIVKAVDGLLGMVHYIGEFVGWLREGWRWMKDLYDNSMLVRGAVEWLFAAVKTGWEVISALVTQVIDGMVTPIKALGAALKGEFGEAFDILKQGGDRTIDRWSNAFGSVSENAMSAVNNTMKQRVFNVPLQFDTSQLQLSPEQMKKMGAQLGLSGAQVDAAQAMARKLGILPTSQQAAPATGPQAPKAAGIKADPFASKFATSGTGSSDSVKQGVSEVVGGGRQVRNVNVIIQSLIKEVRVITSNTVKEGAGEVQRLVTEAMVNAVRSGELALAND